MNNLMLENNGLLYYPNLSGKFLVASPYSTMIEIFDKAVIYVVTHGRDGSMGIIINRLLRYTTQKTILEHLKDAKALSVDQDLQIPIYTGGPTDPEKVFVLHTIDHNTNDHNTSDEHLNNIAVSSSMDVLKNTVQHHPDAKSIFALGYTLWHAEQLEFEIKSNLWLACDYDEEIMFNTNSEDKWNMVLHKLQVDNVMFSPNTAVCS